MTYDRIASFFSSFATRWLFVSLADWFDQVALAPEVHLLLVFVLLAEEYHLGGLVRRYHQAQLVQDVLQLLPFNFQSVFGNVDLVDVAREDVFRGYEEVACRTDKALLLSCEIEFFLELPGPFYRLFSEILTA